MKEDKHCGNCCWFYGECMEGDGFCPHELLSLMVNCGDECTTGEFISKQEMRHHMAVLLQANRYRRDDHVPAIYRMPDPKELGRAIDFACDYIRTFSNL